MKAALLFAIVFGFIGWLHYVKNQQRKFFLQLKEAYLKDIMSRYPGAEELEKLLQSPEWEKLMEVYGKPPATTNRLVVLTLVCLGILVLCVAGAATIITINVDRELIYGAIILSAIGTGLLINAAILNHYLKKWNL